MHKESIWTKNGTRTCINIEENNILNFLTIELHKFGIQLLYACMFAYVGGYWLLFPFTVRWTAPNILFARFSKHTKHTNNTHAMYNIIFK